MRHLSVEDYPLREALIEFRIVGSYVRVSAIDPDTGTEVQIVGSPRVGREVLQRVAIRKLKYVLGRKAGAKRG